MIDVCLNCQAPLQQSEGRRKKTFCSNPCRTAYWLKTRKGQDPRYVQRRTYAALQEKYEAVLRELGELKTKVRFAAADESAFDGGKANRAKLDEAATTPQAPQRHRLWKEGDPAEGTMAFYRKYDVLTYAELEKQS